MMRRIFCFLLGLLGFAATSCEPALDMYGCPTPDYKEDVEQSGDSTERVEPNSEDEKGR
ncbi:MAG: hypothetical protein IJO17_05350 [Alistipes sp.]|nr:hypothetical protein [Alistipes sp.]